MNTVELFCGTKSFSKIAKELGHNTFTSDFDSQFDSDLTKSILETKRSDFPLNIDVVWASPPCTCFSVASIGKNWDKETRQPTNDNAREALKIVQKTIELIKEINPKYWFIENPRGMLRKIDFMQDFKRFTVTYCQYGDTRQKPTDIWTNFDWKPKPMCKPKATCHISAPRGSRTGTQGLKNAKERSVIPPNLFREIFEQLKL